MRKNSRLKSNETFRWERRSLKTADPKVDDEKHSRSRFKTVREYGASSTTTAGRGDTGRAMRDSREKKAGTLTSTNQMKAC